MVSRKTLPAASLTMSSRVTFVRATLPVLVTKPLKATLPPAQVLVGTQTLVTAIRAVVEILHVAVILALVRFPQTSVAVTVKVSAMVQAPLEQVIGGTT